MEEIMPAFNADLYILFKIKKSKTTNKIEMLNVSNISEIGIHL